jgi:Tfp pilus assembly protein PilW
MTSRPGAGSRGAPLRGQGGLTLIELVVAASLLVLVLGGIFAFVTTGGRSAQVTNDFVQTQAQVRAALDTVVDEVRWAQEVTCATEVLVTLYVPRDTPFSATSPYRVTFHYDRATDTLTRRVDTAGTGCPDDPSGEPIAHGLVRRDGSDGVVLEYFDNTGQALGSNPADLTAIARVRMTVTTTRDLVSRTFAGDAAMRARQ